MATNLQTVRRGLPRRPGGDPWPAAAAVAKPARAAESAPVVTASVAPAGSARRLRRGLPRTPGGEPWPVGGFAPTSAPSEELGPRPVPVGAGRGASVPAAVDVSVPLAFTRTAWVGQAMRTAPLPASNPASNPKRYGPFSRAQWAGATIVGGAGLLLATGMAVEVVQFLLSLPPFQEFLARYPGEYPLPKGAPVGIPPFLGWQHSFNVFLMALIIRSGVQVRSERRPSVFWSPRNNGKRKISLNLWLHQCLDVLWITNGVVYIVLLLATGQWMKIVPTSWAVFPNAVSAALQYMSLDWPTENGWVNYNSLQQLAYFATVFLAAPLAIASGVRMSGMWPERAKALNKAYPVEWARGIHFPVMVYFVAFILVHVGLVLATGALRNLNHMYASRDTVSWVGFWIFAASLAVIAAACIAARPLVLAPIARLFGKVSGR